MKLEDPLLILQQTQAIQIFPELIPILGKIYTKKHVTDIICNFIHSINQYNLSNPSLQIEKLFLLQSIVNANFYLASSSSTIKLVKNVVPILEKYFSSGNRKEKIECSYCLSVLLVSHFLLNTLLLSFFLPYLTSFPSSHSSIILLSFFLSLLPSLPHLLSFCTLSYHSPFFLSFLTSFFPPFFLSFLLSSFLSFLPSFLLPSFLLSFLTSFLPLLPLTSFFLSPFALPTPLFSLLYFSLFFLLIPVSFLYPVGKETFYFIYYPLLRLPLITLITLPTGIYEGIIYITIYSLLCLFPNIYK